MKQIKNKKVSLSKVQDYTNKYCNKKQEAFIQQFLAQ
jgi:hypothetical protein